MINKSLLNKQISESILLRLKGEGQGYIEFSTYHSYYWKKQTNKQTHISTAGVHK